MYYAELMGKKPTSLGSNLHNLRSRDRTPLPPNHLYAEAITTSLFRASTGTAKIMRGIGIDYQPLLSSLDPIPDPSQPSTITTASETTLGWMGSGIGDGIKPLTPVASRNQVCGDLMGRIATDLIFDCLHHNKLNTLSPELDHIGNKWIETKLTSGVVGKIVHQGGYRVLDLLLTRSATGAKMKEIIISNPYFYLKTAISPPPPEMIEIDHDEHYGKYKIVLELLLGLDGVRDFIKKNTIDHRNRLRLTIMMG